MVTKPLLEKLLHAIALEEPFSLNELEKAYQHLESLDDLLKAIEFAKEKQASLVEVAKKRLFSENAVSDLIKRSKFRPSADKSSITIGFNIKEK